MHTEPIIITSSFPAPTMNMPLSAPDNKSCAAGEIVAEAAFCAVVKG